MRYEDAFKAAGDATRLRILKLIVESECSVCVCELVDALALPQYLVSKHLTVLRKAGLVEDQRQGTWVGYQPRSEAPPFHLALYELVRSTVTGPQYDRDRLRLQARVALREGGRCVVGYNDPRVPEHLAMAEQQGGCCSE
ncbi:MAG: ArsR/SmtB family transcription factor [Bacillota bacterium]